MRPFSRSVQTTIPCKRCGAALTAERACREVRLYCPACGERYTLEECYALMDAILEEFLGGVPCDRV